MKKLLLTLTLGLTISATAQDAVESSFSTVKIETSSMSWNSTTDRWDFEDNNDFQDFTAHWTFNLQEGGCGGYFVSGEIVYSVYNWELSENGILINFYAHNLHEEGTVIIIVREDNRNSMTFFLPETKRSITFHQSRLD